jgi:hypothetical protein
MDTKVKQTAREATDRVQKSATQATEGVRNCQTAILSATQANMNAMFDYMQEAFSAKSMPELMELSTKHAQRQMQMMTEQAREITGAIQKAAVGSANPLTGFADKIGRMS